MKGIINVFVVTLFCLLSTWVTAQDSTIIEGYAYENGNRGYLNVVQITAVNKSTNMQVNQVFTNEDGFFTFEAPAGQTLEITAIKDMFITKSIELTPEVDKKNFVQFEIKREPGYIFEITMAEKREDDETPVDAISGTRVEVYNNTENEEVLALTDYPHPEFRVNLQKGNHYTILIRKKGYLAKRMEAFVNVKGCILCFEGIGSVRPGVSETMTEGNENGLLLANVALEKVFTGKKLEIENIYYDLAKWDIKPQAETQLKTVLQLMKDNPMLIFELGSHTDSRGKDDYNMDLSQKRARAAVDYLKENGDLRTGSITSMGYGETQITNKCKNGVNCSEAMHAVNRRTELKVTGMLADVRDKSLLQMKTEERLEAEILSGNGVSDQIELLPGESIDDALARIKLENEDKPKPQDNVVSPEIDDIKDAKDEAQVHTEMLDDMNSQNVQVELKDEITDIKSEVSDETQSNNKNTEDKISDKLSLGKLNVDVPQLSEDANGIYIAVHHGADRLPMTHKIYKTFPDLNWYPASDGNTYYIINRNYPSEEKAQAYLDEYIKGDYPNAEVLRFVKGVRRK